MTTPHNSPPQHLARVLAFTPEDIHANRHGRLSAAQAARLRGQRTRSLWIALAVVLGMALVATTLLYGGRHAGAGDTPSPILTVLGIAVMLLNAVIVAIFAQHWRRQTRALALATSDDAVRRVQGTPTLTVRVIAKRAALYLVQIGETELSVAREVFEAFRAKQTYTIYLMNYTGALLSAETES
jgi:hypothetical protein